jgi:N utilization substance protein B
MSNNQSNEKHFDIKSLSQRDQRAIIFHILYAAESYDYHLSVEAIIDNLNRGFELDIPLESDIAKTAATIIEQRDALDEIYRPFLANWRFERVSTCTKIILRYAIWELFNTDTSRTIVMNEAIELAKCYAEKDAYKFVNGILDEIVKKLFTS